MRSNISLGATPKPGTDNAVIPGTQSENDERPQDELQEPANKELKFEDQSTRMPLKKILIVYFGIGLALIVAFMDQTAVSTASPVISSDLNASKTISWVGTAFFVGNCSFQLVYGRLSDIFGRKYTLQAALLLLILGDLLCSFARTPIQLYAFRAIAGVGGGGVTNIAMVIVSDIVPLKERGKYQGFISSAASIGNAVGPFVGGGFASRSSGDWRWLFRVIAIAGVVVIVLVHFIIPLKPTQGSMVAKLKMIDYTGAVLSSAATIFLLVPISGGGSTFPWSSATVIALLVLGVVCLIAFLFAEAKIAKLPILPLRLFRMWTPSIIMLQSFLIGIIYYGNIYYIPIYIQYVKGHSALVSGALVLAWTFPQSFWGVAAGFFVSKTNRYKLVLMSGATVWTLGLALQVLWTPDTPLGEVIGFLELSAIGIGFNLQNTLVAALATTKNEDRAVVTGGRNYFRTLGASFGLAIANAIYQPEVSRRLEKIGSLSPAERESLMSSATQYLDSLPPDVQYSVRDAYSHGLRVVFIAFAAICGGVLLLSFLVKEVKFRKDSPELQKEKQANRNRRGEEPVSDDVTTESEEPPREKSGESHAQV
ncbi:major facilitator superfamily domain-containing protein [Xylaria venustula]|nr:major facilitator superfamily domain-containing protein [Xylaria venustula]